MTTSVRTLDSRAGIRNSMIAGANGMPEPRQDPDPAGRPALEPIGG